MGTRTHGTVTGATPTGVFVSFFNGIRGLVHASALGLAEDQAPDDAFRVGQVRCPMFAAEKPRMFHRVTCRFHVRLMTPPD